MPISTIKTVWAAGFLEGEGHFGWHGKHNGYPLVCACQVDSESIYMLGNMFPGTVRESGQTKSGKTVWEFRATSANAIEIMRAIRDWMSDYKGAQIDECLSRWDELQAKRAADSQRRAVACPHGHPWSEHGSRRRTGKYAGQLFCKACNRERAARQRQAQEVLS